ncbi:hypothetical protein OQA88_10349 [Cercophora sp. LCS_1]
MKLSKPARERAEVEGDLITPLRDASRKLVREWGFLQPTLAGSSLSPGAIHCLIEIGDYHVSSFSGLRAELKVSERQLNKILSELLMSGNIMLDKTRGETEYCLTPAGADTLSATNVYAQAQVTKALATAPPDAASNITTAFRLYAAALGRARNAESIPTPDISQPTSPVLTPAASVRIQPGYRPGLLARTLELHMAQYHESVGWGMEFETELSAQLSRVINNLDKPVNEVWAAVETMPLADGKVAERILGMIYVDGEIQDRENSARIRAFIVDESARGFGLGRKLVDRAMAFVREQGFSECRLSTMRQLCAARKLYEDYGFKVDWEKPVVAFGVEVPAMEYIWNR